MPENPSSGNSITTVAKDTVTITGVNPNLAPSLRIDNNGEEASGWKVMESSGLQNVPATRPTYQEIDNSSDHIGGSVTHIANNKYNINAGSGGINFLTNGNINFQAGGGLISMTPTECFSCVSKTINLTVANTAKLSGEKLFFDATETFIEGNIFAGGNMAVKGGFFCNGELFVTHMTCQRERHITEDSKPLGGYINPVQPFIITAPSGLAANITITGTVDGLPGVVSGAAVITGFELTAALINSGMAFIGGKYDVIVPPHVHQYDMPACSLVDDTSEVWSKASDVNNNSPVQAKQSMFNGMTAGELMKSRMSKWAQKGLDCVKAMIMP